MACRRKRNSDTEELHLAPQLESFGRALFFKKNGCAGAVYRIVRGTATYASLQACQVRMSARVSVRMPVRMSARMAVRMTVRMSARMPRVELGSSGRALVFHRPQIAGSEASRFKACVSDG